MMHAMGRATSDAGEVGAWTMCLPVARVERVNNGNRKSARMAG